MNNPILRRCFGLMVLACPYLAAAAPCTPGNGGITLPPGFCASVFADNLGHVRQLAVGADGTLYANSMEEGGGVAPSQAGGFLIAMQDPGKTGHATMIARFGPRAGAGYTGGTGIGLFDGALYAESNTEAEDGGAILRYRLTAGGVPQGEPETVVSGLPTNGDHPMHPFLIDGAGDLFVDLGSATNACQGRNRVPGVRGMTPCEETRTRAGVWRYDARGNHQVFGADARYATGLRNAEGYALAPEGTIFVTQHGRDQLHQNWPAFYTASEGQELPSEEMVLLRKGADYGWPECYYDPQRRALMLAPEYGGDGKRTGECAGKQAPVAAFPAHWAPNDAKFYAAGAFPPAWRQGVFIAFHGSWNRAPGPQGGYAVVFQPVAGGTASGPWRVFADGFAGGYKDPERAAFRPTGLAVAPDGALFISEDQHGRIWRVTYQGGGQ